MPYRKFSCVNGGLYYIFNRSISGQNVFASDDDFARMTKTISFYRMDQPFCRLSIFMKRLGNAPGSWDIGQCLIGEKRRVDIIGYCFMPTHFHLILRQLKDNGISEFMSMVLKSHSKYFNFKYNRHGPLWESRFKVSPVETPEQLLHLINYIHLEPVRSSLAASCQDWVYSSYSEYKGENKGKPAICEIEKYVNPQEIRHTRCSEFLQEEAFERGKIERLLFD